MGIIQNQTAMRGNISYLGDFDGVRVNNFTPVRLVLSLAVLYGHSFAVSKTPGFVDHISRALQSTWIGEVAVNAFFVISGFLVTGSLVKRGVLEYVISRILRVYPGLFVNIVLTILVTGLIATTVSFTDFFTDPQTGEFFLNTTLVTKIQWYLPGTFEYNTRPAINGSLWTLPVEVRCYFVLVVLGIFGFLSNKFVANVLIAAIFLWGFLFPETMPLFGQNENWLRVSLFFAVGVLFYVNRATIPMMPMMAIACLIFYFYWQGKPYFNFITSFALAYIVFFVVYKLPVLPLDRYLGDLSYGVYIYAWPAQQIVEMIFPDNNPYQNGIISAVIVLSLAKLSWNYVEKPSLDLKKKIMAWHQSVLRTT